MAPLLQDKVTIITGASRGIGAAAARLFAAEGARLVLTARSADALEALAGELRSGGADAIAVPGDAVSRADAERVVAAALHRHGRLDCAFVNHGALQEHVPLASLGEDVWDAVVATNLTGVWLALRAQVPAMVATGGGAIVVTSSIGGLVATEGLGAYQTAKHGLVGLVKAATADYGPQGVRVNAIAPGQTLTDMMAAWRERDPGVAARIDAGTPLRRGADPAEIAEAAAWLLSDRASFVAGATLPVDGGHAAVRL